MARLHGWIVLALVATTVGCQSMGRPQWFNPGSSTAQRQRAERFDPYPDTDTGPAMVGARPHDYSRPSAEATRARWNQWGLSRFGHQ